MYTRGSTSKRMKVVGVISDTHGLLRWEAEAALADADYIIHAGDIGSPQIIERLQRIAPVTAVRGNNDKGQWAEPIPASAVTVVEGRRLYVLHDISELNVDPVEAGYAAVIAGHSHKPAVSQKDGVLFLNPGSAGPTRFKLPIAIAKLYVSAESIRAEIHTLDVKAPAKRAQ
jgi:uncharacterized protein